MKFHLIWTLLALAFLTACASSPRMNEREARDRYMNYASAPVSGITYLGRFDSWRPLGRDKLVVWTGINNAYLLTVEPFCTGLEFAEYIGLTQTGSTVSSGFDYVKLRDGFRRERCRITEIRPVDYKQMKADMKAAGE